MSESLIININQFFIILILKVGVLNALYFKYIYPGFHRQGLSLVLDKNVNLSCFNWKKLALTDLKYISAFVLSRDAHQ